MLNSMGASGKVKAVFVVMALLCIAIPCLTVSCGQYTCTLEDIARSSKVDSTFLLDNPVYNESTKQVTSYNRSISDNVTLVIWCDRELSEGEIRNFKQLGIAIYEQTWIPPMPPDHPWGLYFVDCKVGDICRLAILDKVKRISSGETPGEFTQ